MEQLSLPATARLWTVLIAGLLVVVHVGCEDTAQQAARRNNLGPVGPEESFKRIMERLKRRLEQGPRHVVSSGLGGESGATSSFSLQTNVTGELLEPEDEGTPHRAEVIIRTHADYVHTRTAPEAPSERPNGEAADSLDAILNGDAAAAGIGEDPLLTPDLSLSEDPLAADAPAGEEKEEGEPGTDTLTDPYDEVNRYELVYKDRRWVLAEPIAEDREALQRIFEYALEGQ